MNSVMDDNRLLTLPNGERIRLQPHCAMICETFDLQYASPATISRCGMVWVDPKNLGYRPYYERWIRTRFGNTVQIDPTKQETAEYFMALFEKYVPPCVDMILSGLVDGEMGQKLQQVVSSLENVSLTDSSAPEIEGPAQRMMLKGDLPAAHEELSKDVDLTPYRYQPSKDDL